MVLDSNFISEISRATMSFIICWRASIVLVFLLRVFSWSYCYGYVYSDSTNYPKRSTVFTFLANHQASPSSTINFSSRLSRMDSGERSLSPTEPPSHHHKGREVAPSAEAPSIAPSRHHHHKKPKNPVAASPSVPQVSPEGCSTTNCTEPLTYSPPDSSCGCVLPMQVVIEFAVAPYAIFPMITELADEVASGTYLKPSQVRIIGANAANQDQDMTTVKIDLVPLEDRFDSTTAFLTFQRLWEKKVVINRTLFGDYQVVYFSYPGLPPSPPSPFGNLTSGANGNPRTGYGEDPLGVDIKKRNEKMDHGTIAVVAFSSAVAVFICCGVVWLIILRFTNQQPEKLQKPVIPTWTPSVTKKSGGGSIRSSSMTSSVSLSFFSSVLASTGAAKVFTLAELEKATSRFSSKNIVGEGGFGRVYQGGLEDGTTVAVKVLTRDDHQGGREFIAEVEMLSRLHHRNLVKLIGICTEGHRRCLVYELIPNGSVESHLHGQDKESAPLDWDARMKIALGAARGLAYLHEDSNPRVIHRDFKASNILLEDDFTPKVSDFGLAKVATDEGKGHISTRVMGTFGYVAPEYAMTGHLLVKSDVYSYGVVLLELLTGRKPVDMSQPPGQENLVTWARPLLSSRDGLETLIDPNLKGSLSFDSVSKVAAIASMCVQPEVSNRPFMGEVVQALKLVYNDADASNGEGSQNQSEGEDVSSSEDSRDNTGLRRYMRSNQYGTDDTSFVTIDYDSGPLHAQDIEAERPLSASALLLSSSGRFDSDGSESFRRHSSSGPLRIFRSKRYGYRIRGLVGGSMSEHSITRHFSPASKLHRDDLFL